MRLKEPVKNFHKVLEDAGVNATSDTKTLLNVSRKAEADAVTTQQDIYNNCVSANAARDAQRNTWDYILNLAKQAPNANVAGIDHVKVTIDKSLTDRVCPRGTR